MRSLSKILLPVDFSERSVGAAHRAKTLAAHFGSQITLLHVLPPPPFEAGPEAGGGAMMAEWLRTRTDIAKRDLDLFLADQWEGLEVERLMLEGEPASRIVEYAHENGVDLIIMPTHGYGPFRRFILGSNTAKVLHDADCPIWTGIHMQEAPAAVPQAIRHVLCAVDLGPQSEKAFAWAAWLAREVGANLTLLHAMACTSQTEASWSAQVRESVEEEFARLQSAAQTQAQTRVEVGEPAHVVCTVAQQSHADVLVIGRGSAAGVFGRLRTNAYTLIRQSPCPVVSV